MDASPDIGGTDKGVRPMQMIIMGLGGCSGIDVCNILKKQRQEFNAFNIEVAAKRRDEPEPKIFEYILMKFIFEGGVDPQKAKRAVDLSIEKYCSVSEILRLSGAALEYQVIVNNEIVQ